MNLHEGGALTSWLAGEGPLGDGVISSRTRLARNLEGFFFPTRMDGKQAEKVASMVVEAASSWRDERGHPLRVLTLQDLTPLERQVLVEKHLASPLHIQQPYGVLLLSEDETLSVMINEEDQLRIQKMAPGLNLEEAYREALRFHDHLKERLPFAYHSRLGYLTAHPANVGTGLRASVLCHLPGHVYTQTLEALLVQLSQRGITARGLYGEGSQASGNLYQISNSRTLGLAGEDIVAAMDQAIRQVVQREWSLREALLQEGQLEDRIWRAYGILTHARSISSGEAMELLSLVRLGVDLHVLPPLPPRLLNQLIVRIRPAFLQAQAGEAQDPLQRDRSRARLIRQMLTQGGAA
ncbi:MAG: protein arginine kinase [Bacillota bacterium]|nr:protein arginine kinase [Bacillota bacterium]